MRYKRYTQIYTEYTNIIHILYMYALDTYVYILYIKYTNIHRIYITI